MTAQPHGEPAIPAERSFIARPHEVRAILDGRQTQFRRAFSPPPTPISFAWLWKGIEWGEKTASPRNVLRKCPYGKPGSRLWVRETWGIQQGINCCVGDRPNIQVGERFQRVIHRAGRENFAWGMYGPPKWKPSIHMPRTACRITLEIVSVRVERLNEIKESDAIEEGITWDERTHDYIGAFRDLWESINGPGSWALNPWVWCVEFRRLTP